MTFFASLRATAYPPPTHPPPSGPLPSLPLQAKAPTPPPTPRNANHLYGEFSSPSLDVAGLAERLEDIAEAEHGPSKPDDLPTLNAKSLASTMKAVAGNSDIGRDLFGSPTLDVAALASKLQKYAQSRGFDAELYGSTAEEDALNEHLAEMADLHHTIYRLNGPGLGPGCPLSSCIFEDACPYYKGQVCWREVRWNEESRSAESDLLRSRDHPSNPQEVDDDEEYHTCSEGEQSDAEDADDGFLDSKDWAELLKMLGWLGGYEGDAQEQLLELDGRKKGERRWGAVVRDPRSR